ncbi:hypothetical protein EZV73_05255 [Acidaminobacter sp. JC074]|uniref:hypothetical protein n=1 Tax=Acidaminobacter sp. JC074 TaxID=2530199 RepID=UPI001F0D03CA|nr:hypothetical protein [Acidaminobacter sp. JC074]MCH4886963.1 hypothetical protein [Acidaminobacter sp. JC074]
MNKYIQTMNKIKASQTFKDDLLEELGKERRYDMNNMKKIVIGIAACAVLAVGAIGFNPATKAQVMPEIDLTERITIDPNAPSACVAVNLEGTIVEVSDDGLSFKLDSGKWVDIDDDTEYGTTLPTSAAIEDQYLEPTFRVGNMIAGFTEDENASRILAYAIYTNWNWDDPIR